MPHNIIINIEYILKILKSRYKLKSLSLPNVVAFVVADVTGIPSVDAVVLLLVYGSLKYKYMDT